MGNRAVVVFKDQYTEGTVAGVYLHWGGSRVRDLLKAAETVMQGRVGDASYSAARFCQVAGNKVEGNLSLGLVTVDIKDPSSSSPGDAGVFVVNVTKEKWLVDNYGGSEHEGAFAGTLEPSEG